MPRKSLFPRSSIAARTAIAVLILGTIALAAGWSAHLRAQGDAAPPAQTNARTFDHRTLDRAIAAFREGRKTFRFDTFGDEDFWGGQLQLHRAIEGERFAGVGPGISPNAALNLGLKVDVDALPPTVVAGLLDGKVDLDDPATTLVLLKANAVVGLRGVRCRALPGRQGLQFPAGHGWCRHRHQRIRRDPHSECIRTGRLQPAHLDRGLGHRHVLERVRGDAGDARQRPFPRPGKLHKPQEIGIDSFQADRAPDGDYKTMNLAGIFVREEGLFMRPANKGRFYHDGRFATLMDVVNHYDTLLHLGLTTQEKQDLIEYLKSLPEE